LIFEYIIKQLKTTKYSALLNYINNMMCFRFLII